SHVLTGADGDGFDEAGEGSGHRVPTRRILGAGTRVLAAGGDKVAAPLPGLVKSVAVSPGQHVAAGDLLAAMEAMKMEHALRAPRDGEVAEVAAAPGDQVAEGALLVALAPEA
ncbi:MAG: DUF2118 domain-containing protein, partial [Pseudomonadota bacterium]